MDANLPKRLPTWAYILTITASLFVVVGGLYGLYTWLVPDRADVEVYWEDVSVNLPEESLKALSELRLKGAISGLAWRTSNRLGDALFGSQRIIRATIYNTGTKPAKNLTVRFPTIGTIEVRDTGELTKTFHSTGLLQLSRVPPGASISVTHWQESFFVAIPSSAITASHDEGKVRVVQAVERRDPGIIVISTTALEIFSHVMLGLMVVSQLVLLGLIVRRRRRLTTPGRVEGDSRSLVTMAKKQYEQ